MSTFKVLIITPISTYMDKEINSITIKTTLGMMTILSKHADIIANVEISHLTINDNGHINHYAVSGGVLNFYQKENKLVLLINAIEEKSEIDISRAIRAKENAEKRLKEENLSFREQQKTEIKLKRALNRISLHNS